MTKAFLSARRNDDRAHLATQTGPFASLSARTCHFGAHLETLSRSDGSGSFGAVMSGNWIPVTSDVPTQIGDYCHRTMTIVANLLRLPVRDRADSRDGSLRHVPRGSGTGSFDAEQHDEHLYEHDERADSQRPLRAEDARGDCVASMQLNQRLHQDDQHGSSDRTRDLPDRVGDRRPG